MTRTITPAPYGWIGLPFGATTEPYSKNHRHQGQDHGYFINKPESRQTVAPVGGMVTAAYNDGGYHNGWGNYVDIRVNDRVFARLAHHATGTVQVRPGQRVEQGQAIGTMGSTGNAAGVHLHEELWVGGVRVDPLYYRAHHLPGTESTSGGGARPLPTQPEEDTMAYPIQVSETGHRFLLAPGFIKHFTDVATSDLTKNIVASDDKWIVLTIAEFAGQLDSFGVPRTAVDAYAGMVYNPGSRTLERGAVWSWARVSAALSERLDPVLFNGEPGVDLSRPRLDSAISATLDLQKRFLIDANGDGVPDYDLTQLTTTDIVPLLRAILEKVSQ